MTWFGALRFAQPLASFRLAAEIIARLPRRWQLPLYSALSVTVMAWPFVLSLLIFGGIRS